MSATDQTLVAHQQQAVIMETNNSDNDNQQKATGQVKSTPSDIAGTTCMELALEGERLCQSGDLKNGVKFFEEAIKVGTKDDRTLSAIYSQLGNAYFYLEDYQKALDYHKQDVTLVHSIGDEAAEAKACGNLGNTYKMLGKFDEAAVYCRRYLEISRKLKDEIGEGRALYNLGNVYHMQGKRMIGSSEQESGELPQDIKSSLQRAIEYYEANLKVVSAIKDSVAMGRAYGNLGNTHYLLGNFKEAVDSHKRRLELAKQTSDKSAERRAHLNLGNANVFLGNFPEAIENYSETLKLAQELQDKHTEAHSCYSLANTYTFLRDYDSAIKYHLKYLDLIKELDDKLGEGRACWSLVNIYQMVNDPESALTYAKRHHEIAELLNDETGLASAKANIEELEETIAQKQAIQQLTTNVGLVNSSSSTNTTATTVCEAIVDSKLANEAAGRTASDGEKLSREKAHASRFHQQHFQQQQQQQHQHNHRLSPDRRQEQEQRRFKKHLNSNLADIDGLAAARRRGRSLSTAVGNGKTPSAASARGLHKSTSNERLFDMIEHLQSERIDDQRCEILKRPILNSLPLDDRENDEPSSAKTTTTAATTITNTKTAVSAAASAIRNTYRKASLAAYPVASQALQSIQSQRRPTVSAEHRDQLFDLIAGAQGQRMDEQRASLPALQLANGMSRDPSQLARGRTIDHTTSGSSSAAAAQSKTVETIHEVPQNQRFKERSRSIAPSQGSNIYHPPPPSSTTNETSAATTTTSRAKIGKLNKHFQTVDSSDHAPLHDEKFFDSLMRYQSTRFNDQRSEFPKNRVKQEAKIDGGRDKSASGQHDFLNLIVKLGSDRIDDQRSEPPATMTTKGRNM